MIKELLKFNENVQFIENRGDICKYVDEKGNYFLIPLPQLFLNCEYMELNEPAFKMMMFNGEIDKNLEYEKTIGKTYKDKSEITKKAEDKGTVVDAEEEVSRVWIVRNGFKLSQSFNTLEEAHKVVDEFNNKLISNMPKEA